MTNVEADHLDHYGDAASVDRAFEQFTATVAPGGFLVACADDPGALRLAEHARAGGVDVRTYGTSPEADLRVTDLAVSGTTSTWSPVLRGRRLPQVRLAVPGRHLALNSAAALLTGLGLGLPEHLLVEGLGGLHRRAPAHGAQGHRRGSAGLRRLRPPPHRGRGAAAGRPRGGGRGPARGGLPAAPLLPHAGLRRRLRPRPRAGRRGRGHGGLRRGGGPGARGERGHRRGGLPAAARRGSSSSPAGRRCPGSWPAGPGPATSS